MNSSKPSLVNNHAPKAVFPYWSPLSDCLNLSVRNGLSALKHNSHSRNAAVARLILFLGLIISAAAPQPCLGQGALGNGITSFGTLTIGQTNSWTFAANAGDSVVLRMGSAILNPRLQLI